MQASQEDLHFLLFLGKNTEGGVFGAMIFFKISI